MSRAKYLDHLRQVPLFAGCTNKQLDHVARIVTELPMPKGTTIFREGSLAHEFVIVETGSAVVRRNGRKVATVGPGEVLGELALILHRPRGATVEAVTDMNVLVVDSREFDALLDEVPGLARRLLHTVAERLVENSKANGTLA